MYTLSFSLTHTHRHLFKKYIKIQQKLYSKIKVWGGGGGGGGGGGEREGKEREREREKKVLFRSWDADTTADLKFIRLTLRPKSGGLVEDLSSTVQAVSIKSAECSD